VKLFLHGFIGWSGSVPGRWHARVLVELSGSVPLSTASWYASICIGIIWVTGFRSPVSDILMK